MAHNSVGTLTFEVSDNFAFIQPTWIAFPIFVCGSDDVVGHDELD